QGLVLHGGEHEDGDAGELPAELDDGLQPVHVWQLQVEEDGVHTGPGQTLARALETLDPLERPGTAAREGERGPDDARVGRVGLHGQDGGRPRAVAHARRAEGRAEGRTKPAYIQAAL